MGIRTTRLVGLWLVVGLLRVGVRTRLVEVTAAEAPATQLGAVRLLDLQFGLGLVMPKGRVGVALLVGVALPCLLLALVAAAGPAPCGSSVRASRTRRNTCIGCDCISVA